MLGVGGLGHLGIQYANKMGFRTASPSRRRPTRPRWPSNWAAHIYIDSQKEPVAAALQKLGGAKLILATVTSGKAMSDAVGGLGVDGQLIVVGAPADPLTVSAFPLIGNRSGIQGWASGALHRLRRHPQLQCRQQYQSHDRIVPARPRRRSLRPNDVRQRPIPRRYHDVTLMNVLKSTDEQKTESYLTT